MRALIFANGTYPNSPPVSDLVRADDLIIAVDGGTRHAWDADVDPQLVVGDLDSLDSQERARLKSTGTDVVSFSSRKDQTDLELALVHAASAGVQEIVIVGALGGRVDQTIANLLLLSLPELIGRDVRVVHGPQDVFVIRDEASIQGRPGDTVSLIPLAGDAVGVSTEGLEWTLDDETLHFGRARGVSNVLTEEPASVRVGQGLLLCVVMHKSARRAGSG